MWYTPSATALSAEISAIDTRALPGNAGVLLLVCHKQKEHPRKSALDSLSYPPPTMQLEWRVRYWCVVRVSKRNRAPEDAAVISSFEADGYC